MDESLNQGSKWPVDVSQQRSHRILLGQDRTAFWHSSSIPIDSHRGIVPANAALGFGTVRSRAPVFHDTVIFQGQESMGKTSWNPELRAVCIATIRSRTIGPVLPTLFAHRPPRRKRGRKPPGRAFLVHEEPAGNAGPEAFPTSKWTGFLGQNAGNSPVDPGPSLHAMFPRKHLDHPQIAAASISAGLPEAVVQSSWVVQDKRP